MDTAVISSLMREYDHGTDNRRSEGQYRVTASISPVKYWDSVPGNNHVTVAITVANGVKKSEALKGPRYGN